jgi:hypothetical protein
MAWKVRTHFVPAMTGHSDSAPAPSMALAAMSPGATNASYGTPATLPELSSTSPPNPNPIAARNITGLRT